MTMLQWVNGGRGIWYGWHVLSDGSKRLCASVSRDGIYAEDGEIGRFHLYRPEPRPTLTQGRAIANLLYCHLIGEIDLAEVQR